MKIAPLNFVQELCETAAPPRKHRGAAPIPAAKHAHVGATIVVATDVEHH